MQILKPRLSSAGIFAALLLLVSCFGPNKKQLDAYREYSAADLQHMKQLPSLLPKVEAIPDESDTIFSAFPETDSILTIHCIDYQMLKYATGKLSQEAFDNYRRKDNGTLDLETRPLWLSSSGYNEFIGTGRMKDLRQSYFLWTDLQQDSASRQHFIVVIKTLSDTPAVRIDNEFRPAVFIGQCCLFNYETGELYAAFTLSATSSDEVSIRDHGPLAEEDEKVFREDVHQNVRTELESILKDITGNENVFADMQGDSAI